MTPILEQVRGAVANVYDPCSVSAGIPLSVWDMGLVTSLDIDAENRVSISLRPTSAMCTMIGCIMQAVDESVRRVPSVRGVTLRIDHSSMWSEADMTQTGRLLLEARRRRSHEEVPVRPQEWRTRRAGLVASLSK